MDGGHRGGFGGGGPGRHGGGGQYGRQDLHSGRKLSSSDLQLILLAQLAERSAHGYELMKAMEDHSHGLYAPSPGMIYPALTYLEEIGFASVETEGSKKRYSLTEEGRNYLTQNREVADRILSDLERIGEQMARNRQELEGGFDDDRSFGPTSQELESARRGLRQAQRKSGRYSPEESQRIAEILNRAAAEILNLLRPSEEL